MSFLTGTSGDSYKPTVTGDTTAANYWLNWRVFLCALWISGAAAFSVFLIWKHEGFFKKRNREEMEEEEETAGTLYDDETWTPCLKGVHPGWLLGFRCIAFVVLLIMLIITSFVDGGSIFYYYTQWTFTLITIYFGLGTLLSSYGCYEHHRRQSGDKVNCMEVDSEQGAGKRCRPNVRKIADTWGYVFQIIFQINAGAVVLTDCVFWFIIVPFLMINHYSLSLLDINMHTVNVVLLVGDTALNCLRFPLFRIGYFFLWTVIYVIFQWLLHACETIWLQQTIPIMIWLVLTVEYRWPYPFLDLSSQFAPLWYIAVATMHLPCYGIFMLVIKLKHFVLSRCFPQSYQCPR